MSRPSGAGGGEGGRGGGFAASQLESADSELPLGTADATSVFWVATSLFLATFGVLPSVLFERFSNFLRWNN